MTTDTKPRAPTDAELAALIDKEMREYSIGAYADHGSARNQLEHFARAVLAKLGAQPVPAWYALVPVEPSAEMVDAAQEAYMPFGDMQLAIQLAIAAAPQPVVGVEPAQWQKRHQLRTNGEWENTNEHDAKWWRDNSQGWEIRALYTTPQPTQPQAGAVPLTDEQIRAMCKEPWIFDTAKQWVRLIEAAHGIGITGGQS
jgi:hypothetical protein